MEVTRGAYESPKCPLRLSVSKDMDMYLKIRIYDFLRILVSSSVAVSEYWLSQPNLKIFLGELQVHDMNFETAKYEHSLHAKSFVRTAVFGGGSILAVDFRWCLKSTNFKPPMRGFNTHCECARGLCCPGREQRANANR